MSNEALIAVIAGTQLVLMTALQAIIITLKDYRDAQFKRVEKAADAERRKLEKDADYARQDEVARKAAEATASLAVTQKALLERADDLASRTALTTADVTAQLEALDDQGKKIHILVNSDMTAARTNERDQTKLTLMALRRVQALTINLGLPQNDDELVAIEQAEKRILELDAMLADRLAAQHKVEDADAAKDKAAKDKAAKDKAD